MMLVQALWAAAAQHIPVTYVICNNASCRVLKVNPRRWFAETLGEPDLQSRYLGMDFTHPFDMAAIAQAMGVYGQRVEEPDKVGPTVSQAIASGGPSLIDVVVDGTV